MKMRTFAEAKEKETNCEILAGRENNRENRAAQNGKRQGMQIHEGGSKQLDKRGAKIRGRRKKGAEVAREQERRGSESKRDEVARGQR